MRSLWKWIRGHLWLRRGYKSRRYIPLHDITVVVAGNYRQFTQWCFKNQKHPSSRQVLYIPVHDPWKALCGISGRVKEVVYTGTWRQRPDLKALGVELDRVLYESKSMWDYDIANREDPY